ncbi:hypothetical protein Tco_0201840 [Tanacetum coccineum]
METELVEGSEVRAEAEIAQEAVQRGAGTRAEIRKNKAKVEDGKDHGKLWFQDVRGNTMSNNQGKGPFSEKHEQRKWCMLGCRRTEQREVFISWTKKVKAKPIKCYNCNGDSAHSRNGPSSKATPRFQTTSSDKMLTNASLGNVVHVTKDEEQHVVNLA